ncbi:MAG: aldo/keto reductase [Gammaproteobacteria bacterium]|nr:aldo/keto reductase [Gammaproteobacteria bacterium]
MKRTNPSSRRGFLRRGAFGSLAGLFPFSRSNASTAVERSSKHVQRYVPLGRTGFRISDITFGSSRLRRGQDDLVRHALDRGVNYFDTADSYTNGASERVIGQALGGERDKVYIASKTHVSAGASRRSIMGKLEASLKRLGTDYIDVYFNHAVNRIDRLENPEWSEFVDRAKQQGKIRFVGMSGHAGNLIECLDHALDADSVDVLLVAYNFGQDPAFYDRFTRSFDLVAKQPDLPRVLAKAKTRNVGVVTMKTLMGARLNDMRPYEKNGASFAQAAFRWVLSNPNVDAVTISMTSTARIDEYLGASGVYEVSQQEFELLKTYAHLNGASYCRHACNDCESACPYGVPIADVLRTRMYATDYQDVPFARSEYALLGDAAAACLGCSGKPCQGACTHGLPIEQLCEPTHRMLA